MTFYCVGTDSVQDRIDLLERGCQARSVPFQRVDPSRYDFVSPLALESSDMVYRVSRSDNHNSRAVEWSLLRGRPTTFYTSSERAYAIYPDSYILHAAANLPIPRTIGPLRAERDFLRQAVEAVHGFPVIIKALGGSHGVGVMKIDSWNSLLSVVDYVVSQQASLIMRQFIPVTTSARLVVLGDRVIDSIRYTAPAGDFRSNEGTSPEVAPYTFSAAVQATAVAAVRTLGLEFGGVDILIAEDESHYITEVNFPCNFARAQHCTGVDIAGHMVDYLVAKAAANTATV